MTKTVIFGNSSSGKSTLAKHLASSDNIGHLDLDTVAWAPTSPPTRLLLADSQIEINRFLSKNDSWVIEGCYSDLLSLVVNKAEEVIFLNLPVATCIKNARLRPWEPHKYPSKEAQDANLDMLIDWISQYEMRTDTFSQQSHLSLFDNFEGKKKMYTSNV
ncbi:MAG: shikimate kinase [Pseudomonadota bacterium]